MLWMKMHNEDEGSVWARPAESNGCIFLSSIVWFSFSHHVYTRRVYIYMHIYLWIVAKIFVCLHLRSCSLIITMIMMHCYASRCADKLYRYILYICIVCIYICISANIAQTKQKWTQQTKSIEKQRMNGKQAK